MARTPDRPKSSARRPLPRVIVRILWALALLGLLLALGTAGLCYIGEGRHSLSDCFYMTAITVTTVGYGEIVSLDHSPGGRIFVSGLAVLGFGLLTFTFSSITVFFLETDLNEALRRRRMETAIRKLYGHYIICGFGRVGLNVAAELEATGRHFVAIDENLDTLETHKEKTPGLLYLHGDASDDDMLLRADIADAVGVFAVTGDDSRNLMITLTARQLNPKVRVVARCHELRNSAKMRKAGANAVVSPDFTGGMRIASMMVRPSVVSFLEEMLRTEHKLRIEEVRVPSSFQPRRLVELNLRGTNFVLLAVRADKDWVFNPDHGFVLHPGHTLIAMVSPAGRQELASALLPAD
ncbi:MAG: NAD-binding protein [Betaproteobacteria bacterium]|nr:NAD-binding protein [Betaproteobacteria bacterium]